MKESDGENDRGGTGVAKEGKSWKQIKTGGGAERQSGGETRETEKERRERAGDRQGKGKGDK